MRARREADGIDGARVMLQYGEQLEALPLPDAYAAIPSTAAKILPSGRLHIDASPPLPDALFVGDLELTNWFARLATRKKRSHDELAVSRTGKHMRARAIHIEASSGSECSLRAVAAPRLPAGQMSAVTRPPIREEHGIRCSKSGAHAHSGFPVRFQWGQRARSRPLPQIPELKLLCVGIGHRHQRRRRPAWRFAQIRRRRRRGGGCVAWHIITATIAAAAIVRLVRQRTAKAYQTLAACALAKIVALGWQLEKRSRPNSLARIPDTNGTIATLRQNS